MFVEKILALKLEKVMYICCLFVILVILCTSCLPYKVYLPSKCCLRPRSLQSMKGI
jgi:hypothetical protein